MELRKLMSGRLDTAPPCAPLIHVAREMRARRERVAGAGPELRAARDARSRERHGPEDGAIEARAITRHPGAGR